MAWGTGKNVFLPVADGSCALKRDIRYITFECKEKLLVPIMWLLKSFPGILKEIIESGDSPKQIFNVDETVYRSENPRALKNYVKSTLPVIWKANPKAWVTSILFEEWITKHFIPEVKQYCSKNNLAYKFMFGSSGMDQPNVDEITTDIVHLANRLPDIAVTTDDIDDLLSSHSQELTDEDLIELEAQVQKEALESQEIASSISDSEKELTLRKLSVAFANLKNAMKIFEENDPNFERSFNVNNKICAAYHCYQDLYDSKKKEAKQSRIDSFFKPKV
ncbi:unnamed protein product [Leptosia nina]|uniref:DDE-1 domain-containing protein n=1 Tax=Leptosia nina TaxID=320188 RepID=A0AAV1K1F6_9NEOP